MTDYDVNAAADKVMDESGRPKVRTSERNPADIAKDVARHIIESNEPPRLFRMGDSAAVVLDDEGALQPLDNDRWLYQVANRIDFTAARKSGAGFVEKVTSPPQVAMRLVPTVVMPKLPELTGIVHSPYLDDDGNVISAEGYNEHSRLVLAADGVGLPRVAEAPDPGDLHRAVRLLTDEWLGDFPFGDAADRANAIALLLTITGRAFFGLAPMFVIDASTPGSGKGLLVNTVSLIATGESPNLLELPSDGDEQRKVVTTALLAGNELIVWDESHIISGRTMARILTAELYSDRLLGGNKMLTVRNRFTQVAIGNNTQVWGDMKRRVVPVRLVPECERPEERGGFRHPDLSGWVADYRGELLAAAFTIWRAWIAAGRPDGQVSIGSFERWARAVGGALDVAEVGGFLEHTQIWLSEGDDDAPEWELHLLRLRELFGGQWFTTDQVAGYVRTGSLSLPYWPKDDKPLAKSIGYKYRGLRDRWHGGLRLVNSGARSGHGGVNQWCVERRSDVTASDNLAGAGDGIASADRPMSSPPSPPSPPRQRNGTDSGGQVRTRPVEMVEMVDMRTSRPSRETATPPATRRSGFGGVATGGRR